MRELFPEFYEKNEEEQKEIWKNGLIIFDTNNLLNFYSYSTLTSAEWMRVLMEVKGRVYLPYLVAYEYQKNRVRVIKEQEEENEDVLKAVVGLQSQIMERLEKSKRYDDVIQTINQQHKEVLDMISVVNKSHPRFSEQDTNREFFGDFFKGKIGSPLSEEELGKRIKSIETRYQKKTPPGYRDADKKQGESKYADALIWMDLLEKAKTEKRPVIFITEDKKEDWWILRGNSNERKIVSVHPNLVREMWTYAGQKYLQFTADKFLFWANSYLEKKVDEKTIAETETVSDRGVEEQNKEINPVVFKKVYCPDTKNVSGSILTTNYDQYLSTKYDFSKFATTLIPVYENKAIREAMNVMLKIHNETNKNMAEAVSCIQKANEVFSFAKIPEDLLGNIVSIENQMQKSKEEIFKNLKQVSLDYVISPLGIPSVENANESGDDINK